MINNESNVMNDVLLLGLHPCRLIVIAPKFIERFSYIYLGRLIRLQMTLKRMIDKGALKCECLHENNFSLN